MSLKSQLNQLKANKPMEKERFSLLFNWKEAADIDRSTIYTLSLEGLRDLALKDQRFSQFEKTLFSNALKDQDRTMLTKDESDLLDKNISLFLRMVSPYLLLPSSFKAMEWLIRRFRINEFNVDFVLEAILPFMGSTQFDKILDCLVIEKTSLFAFLKQSQAKNAKSDVNRLSRGSFLKIMIKEKSLLTFILNSFKASKKLDIVNYPLVSFTNSILLEYFHLLPTVADNDLLQVLPFILDGLESLDADYQASARMFASFLSKKAVLEKDIFDSVITGVVKGIRSKKDLYQGLLSCSVIYGSQKNAKLPMEVVSGVLEIDSPLSVIIELTRKFKVDSFLVAFSTGLVKLVVSTNDSTAATLLTEILNLKQLSTDSVKKILPELLKNLQSNDLLKQSVKSIQHSRFQELDSSINLLLSGKDKSKYKGLLSTIYGSSSNLVSFDGENTTIYLALQHPEVNVRSMAVSKLQQILETGSKEVIEDLAQYIQTPVLNLLNDTPKMVGKVLSIQTLEDFVDHTDLEYALVKVIENTDLVETRMLALNKLVKLVNLDGALPNLDVEDVLFGSVLQLEIKSSNLEYIRRVMKDFGSLNDAKLKALFTDDDETEQDRFYEMLKLVIQAHCQNSVTTKDWSRYMTGIFSGISNMRILSMMVLNLAVKELKLDYVAIYEYLNLIESNLKHIDEFKDIDLEGIVECPNGYPLQKYLSQIRNLGLEKFEDSFYFHSLCNLINHCEIAVSVNWQCPKNNHLYEKIVMGMLDSVLTAGKLIHTNTTIQGKLTNIIVQRYLGKSLLEFCFACLISVDSRTPLKITACGIAYKYLQTCLDKKIVKDLQVLVPLLMIAFCDEEKSVRLHASKLLSILAKTFDAYQGIHGVKQEPGLIYGYDVFYGSRTSSLQYLGFASVKKLVEVLSKHSQEMVADSEFLKKNLNGMLLSLDDSKKRTTHDDVVKYLCSNVVANAARDFRWLLLRVLENVNSPLKIRHLYQLLPEEVSTLKHHPRESLEFLKRLLECFNVQDINSVFLKQNGEILDLFCNVLARYEDEIESFACTEALGVITSSWFGGLSIQVQQRVFATLVDVSALANANIAEKAKEKLVAIKPFSKVIIHKLIEVVESLQPNEEAKRHKSTEDDNSQQKLDILVAFLEFLQTIATKVSLLDLVPKLALLLDGILNFPLEAFTNVEYCKQVLLIVLETILKNSEDASMLTEESLRADLVVQCIRMTENPQTHNSAMLLLAAMGTTHPSIVLVNIMPVFTFMGANILRQDDNYSFHVVQQTLETIIPALLQSGGEDALVYVRNVLDVFVNALQHVPSHRRLRLFQTLIETVGAEKYLGSLVVLLISSPIIAVEKSVIQTGEPVNVKKFALQLLSVFDRQIQLNAICSIIQILQQTPDEAGGEQVPAILDTSSFKVKTIRLIKLHSAQFVNFGLKQVLENDGAGFAGTDGEAEIQMRLIEKHLELINATNKHSEDTEAGAGFEKYKNLFLNCLYDNLAVINSMLSLELFLRVLDSLLQNSNLVIQLKSMQMIQDRIKTLKQEDVTAEQFGKVTSTVFTIFRETSDDDDFIANKQEALLCLSALVVLVGAKGTDRYYSIMEAIIGKQGLNHPNSAVYSTAMVALAPFIQTLSTRTIPLLQKFIPKVIEHVKDSIKSVNDTTIDVLKSAFTCLNAAFSSIPKFMSSFISPLIVLLGDGELSLIEDEEIQDSRKVIVSSLCENVEHRVLFPILSSSVDSLMNAGTEPLLFGVDFLKGMLMVTKQGAVVEFKNEWLKLFLNIFDYKQQMKHLSRGNAEVEGALIDLFTTFTLKTNERAFKPIFLKIVEWGTDEQERESRMEFFFHLVTSLLNNLKSVFVPFFSFLLEAALEALQSVVLIDGEPLIWRAVMEAFVKYFMYDTIGNVTMERFEKVMNPIVDQLEVGAEWPNYQSEMKERVIPAIGYLAKACHTDEAWKQLNKAVLMKSRSEHASVRWASLSAISELYNQLGEEMLAYFPETIPFLAELLEDDDGQVEDLCKDVCLQIQNFLGEPIQQYFTS